MEYTEILVSIRKIVRSINLESKRIQKEFGVSIPQLLCLTYLSGKRGSQSTQKEMKEYLNLNYSTVTGIIDRLEKKGYVDRLPNVKDKRSTYVKLLPAGKKLLKNTPALMQEKLMHKLATLSAEELEQMERSLSQLTGFLNIDKMDASPLLTSESEIGA